MNTASRVPARPSEGGENADFTVNCRLLGAIFLLAFWSYYTSFPGLISSSRIEPVGRLMPYAFPSLHRNLISSRYIDADSFCELAAVMGMIHMYAGDWCHGNAVVFFDASASK